MGFVLLDCGWEEIYFGELLTGRGGLCLFLIPNRPPVPPPRPVIRNRLPKTTNGIMSYLQLPGSESMLKIIEISILIWNTPVPQIFSITCGIAAMLLALSRASRAPPLPLLHRNARKHATHIFN